MPLRILFTTFEGGGHVTPAIVVARELQRRGHTVRVVSDDANAATAAAAGLGFEGWRRAPNRREAGRADDPLDDWRSRWPARVVRSICDAVVCGPASGYAIDTLDQMARFRPDLVVSNELLFGVMIATEAAAMPLALLAPNIWCFPTRDDLPPFGPGFAPARHEFQRGRDRTTRRMIASMFDAGLPDLNEARRLLGLPPLASTLAQLQVAQRVVLGTSRAFDFGADPPPAPFAYAGPLFEQVDAATDPSFSGAMRLLSRERPNVLLACSTAYQAQRDQVARGIEALAGLPVNGIVTLGPALDGVNLPRPPNVVLVPHASHDALLPHCAAMVCHGGHGTLLRALVHGVPVLCIPAGRDQFDNAQRLVQRGAGLRLRRGASTGEIRRAVTRLLDDPAWGQRAAGLGAAIRTEADHGRRAADLLEQVVAGPRSPPASG
jgi:MGT family glycosyltransferase